MKRFASFLVAAAVLTTAACDREDPTEIGGVLVPNESVRTFEVVLDASQFLVMDTAFSAFPPAQTNFTTLARNFEGVLNANALMRFRVTPIIGLPDSSGVVRVDSMPRLLGGRLILKFDTIATSRTGPVRLELYRAGETWDSSTVTWRTRAGTGAGATPWSEIGGTRGVLLDTATLGSADSVVFRVDTLTLRLWRDSAATAPGVLVRAITDDVRLRTIVRNLAVDVSTTIRDTTVTLNIAPFVTRVIQDPTVPAASSDPRVGGVPSWRTVLRLREDLETIEVPCPLSPTCRVRLRDASIARAELMLQPVATPPGFAPELPVTVLAYTLLPDPLLPLVRSPIAQGIGFATFAPASFRSAAAGAAPLPMTAYIRQLVNPTDSTAFRTRYLTLLQGGSTTFGYATFSGSPQLRLRLSVSQEIQLP